MLFFNTGQLYYATCYEFDYTSIVMCKKGLLKSVRHTKESTVVISHMVNIVAAQLETYGICR